MNASKSKKKKQKSAAPVPPFSPPARYPALDIVRGAAIVLMIGYHFCYDLIFFRFAYFDLQHHPFWLGFRGLIVCLFVLVMGISLRLAARQGIRWRSFARRLSWISGCAGLITAASLWLFPERFIFFGILHFIALASIIGLGFIRFYHLNLGLGIALLIIGNYGQFTIFDSIYGQWFGLAAARPQTEDYVPFLPWFGLVLIGLWLGQWLINNCAFKPLSEKQPLVKILSTLGRHSLLIYMLHQPLLFVLFYSVRLFVKPAAAVL